MVTIYTKDYCPYCHKALALLDNLEVEYTNFDVTHDEEKFAEAKEKSGSRTVPQVFVGDRFLGGCDDIHELHADGKLLPIIEGEL